MPRGGARKGSGRKKGVGISFDIQRHVAAMVEEMLMDDAIRLKATKQLAMTLEEDLEHCVYIVFADGKYKIGYSTDWGKRKKSYSTHLPDPVLICCHKTPDAFEIEEYLHNYFRDDRVNGEWFDLDSDQVLEAMVFIYERSGHGWQEK